MRRRQFTFGLPPDLVASSPGVEKLNLPLEVHDRRTFKLVGRGTLQGGVKLAPGRSYLVTAALPDGSRISAQAKAAPGTGRIQLIQPKPSSPLKARDKGRPADVTRATAALAESMTATSVEAYDADGTATQHPAGASTSLESVAIRPVEKPDRSALDFGKVAATVTESAQPAEGSNQSARITAFCGNLLKDQLSYFRLAPAEAGTEHPSLSCSPSRQVLEGAWIVKSDQGLPTYIQLYQPGFPVKNYAVPLAPGDRCTIRPLRSDGELHVDITLANADADLLVRYVGNNMLQEVAQIAESPAILAQNLLAKKFDFPIGAAIGGYVLLRLGELDRLHDWTKNLCKYFPWLPDGVVIYAEHLARVGEHQQALERFLELPKRGLPFTSSGLTYALNRLRQYEPTIEKGLLKGDLKVVRGLVETLGRFCTFVDITRPLLTFTGNNPLRPSRNTVTRFRGASKSIEILVGSSGAEGRS